MKHYLMACVFTLVGMSGAVIACGDDDSSSTPGTDAGQDSSTAEASTNDEGGTTTTGTLKPTVTYNGTGAGTLSVAALSFKDPQGPPTFAGATAKVVSFPGTFDLPAIKDLEPGTYTFFSMLDIGGNNPQEPGPEDPFAQVDGVEIKAGENTLSIELKLMQGDGGTGDGGDEGGVDAGDGG